VGENLRKLCLSGLFFLILGANPCFWVNNGDWYVNMRGMGKVGKKKASKNERKLT